jgi:formate dehydrogenase subunit gamma
MRQGKECKAMQENQLLFNSATWLVWLAPFAGMLAAAVSKRRDPRVEKDRVLRHDRAAILAHWTHGLGTAVLLVSGLSLGFLFVPSVLGGGQPLWTVMNIHFFAVVVFLFGTFYYGANSLLAPKRLREHLPTKDAVEYTKRHYGLLLGFKQFTMPPERKYFESEKMAYIMAAAATVTIIVTGLLKVAAHVVNVPGFVMGIATPAHDIATIVMLAFFFPHIFFAAILPSSWPIFRSMFTGYVGLDYAKHEHAGWLAELDPGESSAHESADSASGSDERSAA